ncbi:hypothetical protein [uncultured Victivallis sp.]|uniref:hypothetical protein n=1 Tax=uncultured Victivallis sp. TaxID=354118 RepID=UPI002591A272|nr:hypothetical protein [uncultured Victivallis sp.]
MRRNRVVKIISTLIMLFFLANAVYALLLWGRSTGVAGAIFNLLTVVSCGAIACCMFAWLYLPGLIDSLFLMRPTRSRPAPLLSPVEALIRQTRYGEALERLNLLIEAGPEFPTAWIMRFDLLRGPLHSPEEAMRTAERYFVRPDRLRSDDNAKLALRYAELARELGRQDEAIRFLTAELRRRGTRYSRAERALLANMLEALKKNDLRRMHLE